MKVVIVLIFLFFFGNALRANECSLGGLNENQKKELKKEIQGRLAAEFKEFFLKKKIQLEQSEISFNIINVRDSNSLENNDYVVDLLFTGRTKRSDFSNRPFEKYLGDKSKFSAYFINFSWTTGRDNEGVPYINYCNIWFQGGLIQVYNTSFDSFLIGSFYPPGGLFARYEYPL